MTTTLTALVVYESMFGNTEAVARAVAHGLSLEGFDVNTVDVAAEEGATPVDHALVVVGAPTHAFSLSRPSTRQDALRQGGRSHAADTGVREWLAALGESPELRPGLAAAFDTRVTRVRRLPKAASTRATHLLKRLGFSMVSRPTGFLVADTQGGLLPGEAERATAWGRHLAAECRDRLATTTR
jgi:hypothetical protein